MLFKKGTNNAKYLLNINLFDIFALGNLNKLLNIWHN